MPDPVPPHLGCKSARARPLVATLARPSGGVGGEKRRATQAYSTAVGDWLPV